MSVGDFTPLFFANNFSLYKSGMHDIPAADLTK